MKEKIISVVVIILAIIAIIYKFNTVENKSSDLANSNIANSNTENNIITNIEKDNYELTEENTINKNTTNVVTNNKGENLVTENITVGSYEENKNMQNISKVIELSEKNFETEVLKSEKTVIVDFYADWCGPCKALSPILEEISKENENIKVCKLNVDNEQNLAMEYGAQYLPTVLIIKNGQISEKLVGFQQKSYILEKCK